MKTAKKSLTEIKDDGSTIRIVTRVPGKRHFEVQAIAYEVGAAVAQDLAAHDRNYHHGTPIAFSVDLSSPSTDDTFILRFERCDRPDADAFEGPLTIVVRDACRLANARARGLYAIRNSNGTTDFVSVPED